MTDDLSDRDRDALERCVALTLAEPDTGSVAQVTSMLSRHDWRERAEFCAYHRQIAALRLFPWENPPCVAEGGRDGKAVKLAAQLVAAGLSIYEPDPARALRAAQARRGREPVVHGVG